MRTSMATYQRNFGGKSSERRANAQQMSADVELNNSVTHLPYLYEDTSKIEKRKNST